ncbi:MAG: hypothetical protein A2W31_06890 [Planctomycetes bacterium RBG_16_64_10]|nr:MAG: hypothetical protein A2W31_06890 [Planctomycetes bacterium RBG_16_64_10]
MSMAGMLQATTPGMTDLIGWFTRKKTTLPKKVAASVADGQALGELHVMGLNGVSREVYMAAPETPNYHRTYALLQSVSSNGDSKAGTALLYLDAAVSPSKKYPSTSYGYFLTAQGAAHSFHHYELPRYFLDAWFRDVQAWAPARVLAAVTEELNR